MEKRYNIKTAMITLALILAGCQSQAIQSTATPTPTEIPATATLIPTNTPEPTATATELVVADNAVGIVGGGYAYVESGKLMLLGADGLAKESDISTITFNNTKDASNIVYALHKAEFDNQIREDFFPKGSRLDDRYGWMIDQVSSYRGKDGSTNLELAGIQMEFVKVKSPSGSTPFPEAELAMLRVFGDNKPVPLMLGLFDSEGRFSSLFGKLFVLDPTNRYGKPKETYYFEGVDVQWAQLQTILKNKIITFGTLFSIPPEASLNYAEPDGYVTKLSPEVLQERLALLKLLAQKQAAAGYKYATSGSVIGQTGAMLTGLEGAYSANQGVNLFFLAQATQLDLLEP